MKVIKNTTIYLGVSIFQSFLSFLLLPVFTYFLGKTEFGLASVINSIAGLLGIFFIFGTQASISRLFFEYRDDKEKLKRFLGTIFLSKIIWNIGLAVLLLVGRSVIFPFIAKDVDFYPYILIAIGVGFFNTLFVLYQTLQQTKQEGVKYAIVQIIYLVVNNGITVLLLLLFKMKAEGIILGTFVADILMTVIVFVRLRKEIVFKIEKDILKEAFPFSWPIFLHALFTWGMLSVNKLILNSTISVEIVGVYTIGFVIAGVVNMVTVALNRSYTPWFLHQMKKEKRNNKEIVRFSEFIVLIYAIAALGLSLFGREVITLFLDEGYRQAWTVIPFLTFGYVFNGLYFFFINIFNYQKKAVKFVPLYTLLSALINVGLNYLLIPYFGMVGSAIASLISMFVLSLSTYFGSRHFTDIGYNFSRFTFLIFLPFVMSFVIFLPFQTNIWIGIFLKIIYAILCISVLLLLNRKQFGDSLGKQVNNFKKYIGGIKGNWKANK